MQRSKLMGIALMTIFIMSAVASATAAAENPEILPVPTVTAPLKFTSEGLDKEYILETTTLKQFVCKKFKGKGEFTSQDSGTVNIDFEECKSGGFNCSAAGDAAGIILWVGADINLVDLKKAGLALKGSLGVELLPLEKGENKLIIKCSILSIEVKGSVLGREDLIKELVKTKKGEVLFDQKLGEQEFKECELLKALCAGKVFKLESTFGGGFELTGLLDLKIDMTFEKEFEVHY